MKDFTDNLLISFQMRNNKRSIIFTILNALTVKTFFIWRYFQIIEEKIAAEHQSFADQLLLKLLVYTRSNVVHTYLQVFVLEKFKFKEKISSAYLRVGSKDPLLQKYLQWVFVDIL